MATINLAEAYEATGATEFERVPDGNYVFRVVEAEARESKAGKLQFRFRAAIEQGPQAKRTASQFITFTDDNPDAVRMFWINMKQFFGFDGAFFKAHPDPAVVAEKMVGSRFQADLSGREVGDRVYDNLRSVQYLGHVGAAAAPVPAAPAPAAPVPAPAPAAAPVPAPPAPPASPF